MHESSRRRSLAAISAVCRQYEMLSAGDMVPGETGRSSQLMDADLATAS